MLFWMELSSSNPSGGSLKFSWLQLAGGQIISLSNQDNAKTTFIAPSVTGTYNIDLSINSK